MTTVSIPSSVTSIGKNAFDGCSGLTTVSIPSSVTSIGKNAFDGCSGLTTVSIPGSVASIGKNAFDGCKNLKKVNITDLSAWLSIGFGDYSNPLCNGGVLYLNGAELKDVVIPSSVTSIGYYAFYGCSGLTTVSIPSSVTSIGKNTFSGCDNLKKVNITDLSAWLSIGFENYASNPLSNGGALYLNGDELKYVVIPDGVNKINDYAFKLCSGLTTVSIPSSVTSIVKYAFDGL